MDKGFDYFSSADRKSDTKRLLKVFLIVWVIAIVCSFILGKNILVYAVIAFIPYIPIRRYRAKHDPFHNIEEGVKKINPEYYSRLVKQASKNYDFNNLKKQEQRNNIFWVTLLHDNRENVDRQIEIYKQNVKRVFDTGSLALGLWFITMFLLVFVYFITRQT